jgi:hypothetical protein
VVILLAASSLHAGALSGTVQDAAGAPLSGAAVYAYDLRLSGSGILTNAAGAFTLDDLPAGRYRLLARPDDADNILSRFYPQTTSYCESPLLRVGPDQGAERAFTLPVGGELSGELMDDDGFPVPAGLTVIARSVEGTATELAFERETETDGDGGFLLRGLDGPGPWAVEVQGQPYPDQHLGEAYLLEDAALFDVTPGERAEAGAHSLLPGVQITGQVRGPDGPVPEASVIVYSGSQIVTVRTDEDGLYLAEGLPPGEALSWTEPPGLALTYSPDDDRPTTFSETSSEGARLDGLDIEAPGEAVLQLVLTDAETGAPVGGASVTLYNDTYTVGKGGSVDDDGFIEITNLHGGRYLLYVYAADEGHVNDWQRDSSGERRLFTVAPSAETAVTLALSYGAVLSGTVLDDDGQPVYGASIGATALDGELAASATTDREGRYVLAGLEGADWDLTATYNGYCASDPGWVTLYWPGVVDLSDQSAFTLDAGAVADGVDFVLPRDDDHDGMGDRWEEDNGLDPTRDDSLEDPDGDGVTNLMEYRLGTDPNEKDAVAGSCGCSDRGTDTAAVAVPMLLMGLRRRRA